MANIDLKGLDAIRANTDFSLVIHEVSDVLMDMRRQLVLCMVVCKNQRWDAVQAKIWGYPALAS